MSAVEVVCDPKSAWQIEVLFDVDRKFFRVGTRNAVSKVQWAQIEHSAYISTVTLW